MQHHPLCHSNLPKIGREVYYWDKQYIMFLWWNHQCYIHQLLFSWQVSNQLLGSSFSPQKMYALLHLPKLWYLCFLPMNMSYFGWRIRTSSVFLKLICWYDLASLAISCTTFESTSYFCRFHCRVDRWKIKPILSFIATTNSSM